MSLSVPAKLGKYEIRGVLGRGAMGVVYDGWDPLISRRNAIKTVRLPDMADEDTVEGLARFRREAQAAGRLSHPNIVSIYEYCEDDDIAYIVMEYVEGRPLKTLLDTQDRLPVEDVVRIAEQLLTGLQFSHERGVIHRDIKPANIILTPDGRVKIADFGIARIDSCNLTQVGTVIGTPAYMSPEQFMAQNVDARTDIYSSGVLLYQMLTGKRPFEGSASAIMQQVLNTRPSRPSKVSAGLPLEFDAVIERAMAPRPADRFADAAQFAHALRAALSASTVASKAYPLSATDDPDVTMPARPLRPNGRAALPSRGQTTHGGVPIDQPARQPPFKGLGRALAAVVIAAGVCTVFALPPEITGLVAPTAARGIGKFIVSFEAWSANLDDAALAKISAAARWAQLHPDKVLTVEGFAAPDGSIEANINLSATRARMVLDQLARDGVKPSRIRLIAHGATDVRSLSEGRRVEIDIVGP